MTRNRGRGLRRGQDVQSSIRGSDRGSTNSGSTSSSNFDEESFWTPLEKNYFSPPSPHLIKSIRNIIQMYKIINPNGLKNKDSGKSYSIELKINRCKRYRDGIEWAVKCARDRHENVTSRRHQIGFNPQISPKYYGRGSLPIVIHPSPDYLTLTLMDSPFSLQTEVLCSPTCLNYNDYYNCNDEAWALHPRFSTLVQKSNFSCYPPYKYQKFPERTPFCYRCYGLQRSCGESSTMDFNIKPSFPDYCFIPSKLPIDKLRLAMSNVDKTIDMIRSNIFNSIEPKINHYQNDQINSNGSSTIEDDFCAIYEFYTKLLARIGDSFEHLLNASEQEKRPDYESWRNIELKMMSQYMDEYKKTSVDATYTYTSALQLLDLERHRINCKDSLSLPSNWTEKALCTVCSTADDWDDNPIMFCDCCYLPMHVKCVTSDHEGDDESWICHLCIFLTSQIAHIDTNRSYDAIRKLGTQYSERRGDCHGTSVLRTSKIDSSFPYIPINDLIYDKFIKSENTSTVDSLNNGWLYVKDPNIYVKMVSNYHVDISIYVPFCMFCGFSTLCPAGGPSMPTNRSPLWAHIKCALALGINPRRYNEENLDSIRRLTKSFYTGRCSFCKRWGSCLAQCSSTECTRFFHIPCITSSLDCLYEWDTVTNKPDILCQIHAKGVSPNSLLRRVQQRLEGDYYKLKHSDRRHTRLGIYAKDFLETDLSSLFNLFKNSYEKFKMNDSNYQSQSSDGTMLVSFNQSGLYYPQQQQQQQVQQQVQLQQVQEQVQQEQVQTKSLPIEDLKIEVDEEVDINIPLDVLPTPSMLLDIFTDLPSFQTLKYSNGIIIDNDISYYRSVCEGAIVLSDLFDLCSDVNFIVSIFNYISKVSITRGLDSSGLEIAKILNTKKTDQFCSGCGIVESKRLSVKRCNSCMASICKNCFSFGVGAARSTSNCTNSQFESGILTCARCYRYVCGKLFGSCHLCGRIDGFLFAGVDCLVHLICAQLLIPPKCWSDGLRLGRANTTRPFSSCYYCRLNIGLTSTCASPTCGVRFHPYCAFVLKGHSKSNLINSNHSSLTQCVGSKKDRSKSDNLFKTKRPGVSISRILCVVHSNKEDFNHIGDFPKEERRSIVFDFFCGIDYTFTHRQSIRRPLEGTMDGKKRPKKPDLRKFLTMQEIMQYGHSGRTSSDNYYCPICFSLYYETNPGLPGDDLHWIGCDGCERWFHWICIGYSDSDPPKDSEWFCSTCKNPKDNHA